MNVIFENYEVCDDIATKIAQEVHLKYQKKINNHISVIINWDSTYDYWKLFILFWIS